jgi:hypothetical protein
MIFKIGDPVRITYKEKTLDGEVFLACSSGLSVTLTFNGKLDTYAGLMPALWVDDGYIDSCARTTCQNHPPGSGHTLA